MTTKETMSEETINELARAIKSNLTKVELMELSYEKGKAEAYKEELEFLTGNNLHNICKDGKRIKNCCICRRLKELKQKIEEKK